MTALSLFDIANANLEALIYRRTADALRKRQDGAYRQRLLNLLAEHAYAAGYTVADYESSSRKQPLAARRQDFMRTARKAGYSLTEIGRVLGGRDHTTILHGIRSSEKREA